MKACIQRPMKSGGRPTFTTVTRQVITNTIIAPMTNENARWKRLAGNFADMGLTQKRNYYGVPGIIDAAYDSHKRPSVASRHSL
jgi:hypothetical protein